MTLEHMLCMDTARTLLQLLKNIGMGSRAGLVLFQGQNNYFGNVILHSIFS